MSLHLLWDFRGLWHFSHTVKHRLSIKCYLSLRPFNSLSFRSELLFLCCAIWKNLYKERLKGKYCATYLATWRWWPLYQQFAPWGIRQVSRVRWKMSDSSNCVMGLARLYLSQTSLFVPLWVFFNFVFFVSLPWLIFYILFLGFHVNWWRLWIIWLSK